MLFSSCIHLCVKLALYPVLKFQPWIYLNAIFLPLSMYSKLVTDEQVYKVFFFCFFFCLPLAFRSNEHALQYQYDDTSGEET